MKKFKILFALVIFASTILPRASLADESIKLEEYTVNTNDGWELSVVRYSLLGASPKKAAVILCHGFNINNKFWDLDKRSALARYLAANGYDVYAPDLRGSGKSSKPLFSRLKGLFKFEVEDIPHMFIKAPTDLTKFNWTIDDHICKDIPAILRLVRKKSGFDKVYWIGHSMGGIIMYGYLELYGSRFIAGFVPISSMIVIPDSLNDHLKLIAEQKPLMNASLIVNTTVASQLRNLTFGTVKHPMEDLLMETENMYDDVVFRFFRICIDDTAPGVVSQFSDSIRKGKMLSRKGTYSYSDKLHLIKTPILFMLGAKDGFLSEKEVLAAFNGVSSPDKEMLIFSKENGYLTDYGHCDLILGKNSAVEVYPAILAWLEQRVSKR